MVKQLQSHFMENVVANLTNRKPTASSTFAIGGVLCSGRSFAVKGSEVLLMNIFPESPAHRKSATR
ncbi:hypothetical protein [Daejeonella oryzae]|uniref:hypothetical protein n=1 Tax=Daejeonella oryzae TaxID=1122943 RepID=UPI000408BE22|nr:hypothetical protein [Daejeonella oryzae]